MIMCDANPIYPVSTIGLDIEGEALVSVWEYDSTAG